MWLRVAAVRAGLPFAAVVGCALAIVATGWVYVWWVPLLVTLGLTAATARRPLAVAALVLAVLAPLRSVPTVDRAVLLGLVSSVVWAACWLWARHTEREADRAVRERQMAATRAVDDERLRIARDLHDMVSHGMSVITIQAEYGTVMAQRDPEAAVQALKAVEETGHETLHQLRQMLDVLRPIEGSDPSLPTSLHPAPGIAELPDLLARTADAGLFVAFAPTPAHLALPMQTQLCIYRVVQEGMANVLQHSGASRADLRIETVADEVRVQLVNAIGPVSSPARRTEGEPAKDGRPRPGHGLVGIRERVAILGGRAYAGVEPDGTYRLEVAVPRAAGALSRDDAS